MPDLETWLDRVYQAGGERKKLDSLYDEWARNYDQHIWASGNPYIAIATGFVGRHLRDFDASILDAGCGWQKLDQSEPYRSYPFSDKEAHLRHWVMAYRKRGHA